MEQTTLSTPSYKGISRTYRPQLFSSVLGQLPTVTTLKNALKQKKTAQAYLFCGTRGTGKTTLARVLAKALNCPHLTDDLEPCNECESCKQISSGKSLNVFEIDGASHRGIDDIRQLNETVVYAPASSGCKIFIIDEAHMLTKEAFNALLKTLEEPPPNVKFFLATTEPHKIPPTILSRCQRFDLRRIGAPEIVSKLKQIIEDHSIVCDEPALFKIAHLSDGSMRVAESLLDQILCSSQEGITEAHVTASLSLLPMDPFFAFDEAFKDQNLKRAFEWASELFGSGKDLSHFLECLLEHYRNILTTQMQLPMPEMHPSLQERYRKSACLYSQEQALYILDYLVQWHQQSSKTPFKRVCLEMMLLHILKSQHRIFAADLVCRLEELQKAAPIKQKTPQPSKKEPPRVEPDLIEKEKAQAPRAAPLPKAPTPPKPKPPTTPAQHETILRFASVELEGLLTKES